MDVWVASWIGAQKMNLASQVQIPGFSLVSIFAKMFLRKA